MLTKENLRIVYMGTPDFAVESLRALVEGGYQVVGVITMPDKPAGRGHKLQSSPVKQYALEQGLPVLQPEKLKDPAFLSELEALQADLQIVVAFRMLPEVVWDMPRLGTFNLHGSLLPQYRGAAPINWAVINGEKETGITTFFLTHEIDTGKVIMQEKTPIAPDENVGSVYHRLMMMGGNLVTQTVDKIIAGDLEAQEQNTMFAQESELKAAPKIFKETAHIDWNQPTERIYNLIRGMAPYPGAWSELIVSSEERLTIKFFQTNALVEPHTLTPGSIRCDEKSSLQVATQDGWIEVLDLQLAGKKRMDIRSLLNGFKITNEMSF